MIGKSNTLRPSLKLTIPQRLLTSSKPLVLTSSVITLIFWRRAKQTTIAKSKEQRSLFEFRDIFTNSLREGAQARDRKVSCVEDLHTRTQADRKIWNGNTSSASNAGYQWTFNMVIRSATQNILLAILKGLRLPQVTHRNFNCEIIVNYQVFPSCYRNKETFSAPNTMWGIFSSTKWLYVINQSRDYLINY